MKLSDLLESFPLRMGENMKSQNENYFQNFNLEIIRDHASKLYQKYS